MGVSPSELRQALEALLDLQREFETSGALSDSSDATSPYSATPPLSPGFVDGDSATWHEENDSAPLDLDEFMANDAEREEGEGKAEEEPFWSFLEDSLTKERVLRKEQLLGEEEGDSVWSGFGTWDELERNCHELDTTGGGVIESMDLTSLVELDEGNTPGHCSSPGMVKISRSLRGVRGLAQLSLANSPGAASSPGLLSFKRKNGLASGKGVLAESPLNPASPGCHSSSPLLHNSPSRCGSPVPERHRAREGAPLGLPGCAPPLQLGLRRNSSVAVLTGEQSGCASPNLARLSRASTHDAGIHA